MYRRRWLQILLCLAGLAAVTYGIVSLYLPSPRWLIVGVKKRSGDVRMVAQHITFLPPLQYYRLKFERRGGWAVPPPGGEPETRGRGRRRQAPTCRGRPRTNQMARPRYR